MAAWSTLESPAPHAKKPPVAITAAMLQRGWVLGR
jgi:hypothetical protein